MIKMTLRKQDLIEFIGILKRKRISRRELSAKIKEHWGYSEYIVENRIKYLLETGLIRLSKESHDIFEVPNG